MLPGGDEECPVNQRISATIRLTTAATTETSSPFKDDHLVVAEDAGDLVHLVSGIAGENEAPRLVITNTTLILHLIWRSLKSLPSSTHLDVIGVDLLSWKNIECTVVISPKEDTASAVVPEEGSIRIDNANKNIFCFSNPSAKTFIPKPPTQIINYDKI